MTVTSMVLRHVINTAMAGGHVLVTGRTDDLFLHRGEPVTLLDGLYRLGTAFDVTVRLDPVDDVVVVRGQEHWQPQPPGRSHDSVHGLLDLVRSPDLRSLVILDQADILLMDPAIHENPDRVRVAMVQRALREATPRLDGLSNTVVLVASQTDRVPVLVRRGTERLVTIEVDLPTRQERKHYLSLVLPTMHGADRLDAAAGEALLGQYLRLSEDQSLRDIQSLARFSRLTKTDLCDPRLLRHRHRFGETPDHWGEARSDLGRIWEGLHARVFGQDEAIDAVVEGIAGAALGLNMTGDPSNLESQPRVVSLLLGPTGVGKTELAKALAHELFGDPAAMVRIDMGAFAQEHAAERLLGAPPGYVGHGAGGELTNAVLTRPFVVILLDEIEKAHARVWDYLMSILDDGRITDAQGRVAYFNNAVILMTANLGSQDLRDRARGKVDGNAEATVDLSSLAPGDVVEVYRRAADQYFNDINRPEVWGRLAQGAVAFQPLRPEMARRITRRVVDHTVFAQGPELVVDVASAEEYIGRVLADPAVRNLGGRQIRNVLRRAFLRLAGFLVLGGHADATKVEVRFDGDGAMQVVVDGEPAGCVDPPATAGP